MTKGYFTDRNHQPSPEEIQQVLGAYYFDNVMLFIHSKTALNARVSCIRQNTKMGHKCPYEPTTDA
jgi:CMP-N-acetylneuraminic acid synthetase